MVYSELAQETIDRFIATLRSGKHFDTAMDGLVKDLVTGLRVDRGLAWHIVGDKLTITNQYSTGEAGPSLIGTAMNVQQSTQVVLQFLAHSADESGGDVISFDFTSLDVLEWEPVIVVSEGFTSHLLMQFLSRGSVHGFLALQSRTQRHWSGLDRSAMKKIGALVSVVMGYQFNASKAETDARRYKALAAILNHFATEAKADAIMNAVRTIAELMSFKQSRLYLYRSGWLFAPENAADPLDMSGKDDPFVQSLHDERSRVIGAEPRQSSTSAHFGNHLALILPLIAKGERLGVLGLWEHNDAGMTLRPQERELAVWIAGELAACLAR